MLVVAAFGLAIYAWAQRVALPAEEMERMIADGAAEPQGALAA